MNKLLNSKCILKCVLINSFISSFASLGDAFPIYHFVLFGFQLQLQKNFWSSRKVHYWQLQKVFKCWIKTLFSFISVILLKDILFCGISIFLVALGPGSLFGLATFSHKLGLYDVQGPIPVVKNVFIPPDTEGALPIELEDVMPLLQFLAPVCEGC